MGFNILYKKLLVYTPITPLNLPLAKYMTKYKTVQLFQTSKKVSLEICMVDKILIRNMTNSICKKALPCQKNIISHAPTGLITKHK